MTRAIIGYGGTDRGPVGARADMTTDLAGIELPSPILTASGCAASGKELDAYFDITAIGGVITKSIMLKPRAGRATPRMAETPSGMLNSIGLQGPGIEAFIEEDLACFEALEVNISCPNVDDRGLVFACNPDSAAAVIQAVRRNSDGRTPIFAKLSPDVTSIVEIAESVVRAGAAGVTLINTLLGMVIDTGTMRPALAGLTGGLSGPAIRPVAVRCIFQVRQAFPSLPIIGAGGVRTGNDALEFLLAGASAVSVGTSIFNDPSAPMRIHDELARLVAERGFARVSDIVGHAHRERDAIVTEAQADPVESPEGAPASDPDDELSAWDFVRE